MKKALIGTGVGITVLVIAFFALNSYIYNEKQEPNIEVISPKSGEVVGVNFTVRGKVPASWIVNEGFAVSVRGDDGTSMGDYWIDVSGPAIGGMHAFERLISTGGIDGTGVYEGPATLTFEDMDATQQYVVPIVIDIP